MERLDEIQDADFGLADRGAGAAFAGDRIPTGWTKAGTQPAEYEVGVDPTIHHAASGYVKSIAKALHGFGTLMQTVSPGEYLGKRVRMSAYVKA